MNLSFWEVRSWLQDLDYCIVGSGITGLSCALELRQLDPDARILILERSPIPQGASTKNAGFACFGSLTEILDDLKTHTEEEVVELVAQRYSGISLLRQRIGDSVLDYQKFGGYEVFPEGMADSLEQLLESRDRINSLLQPVFGKDAFELRGNTFGMKGILPRLICNPEEGQLDPGRMIQALYRKVAGTNTVILSGSSLLDYTERRDGVLIQTEDFEFTTRKLLIATNGFATQLTGLDIQPARAQVLVTAPIHQLELKGSFHLEKGYYYFRNIGNRILLGGGRNLDMEGENTTEFGLTEQIQERLQALLREIIIPGRNIEITHRWSGIMGVGSQKKPLIERLSEHVSCGVRLGGMGVAIGSHIGAKLAHLATD